MQLCPLCGRACPEDHFHAVNEPHSHHLCGREHACTDPATGAQNPCSCAGACAIQAQLQKVEKRRFRGKRDDFEYERVTRQVVIRNNCNKMIPPGRMHHDGPCCCDVSPEDHLCAEPCPQCGYRSSLLFSTLAHAVARFYSAQFGLLFVLEHHFRCRKTKAIVLRIVVL